MPVTLFNVLNVTIAMLVMLAGGIFSMVLVVSLLTRWGAPPWLVGVGFYGTATLCAACAVAFVFEGRRRSRS